ncbi:hypothetical protein LTR49_026275 [Elasticomyces elasticus]|nr:hypothetical protein LTR49_026275 [Elasticomyces elasticus]
MSESSSDEPSSSMFDRKGKPIRQTSVQHTPTPAVPKAASHSRSQHATVKAARAKGPSHVKRPEDAILASYTKFGLDARRIIIVAKAQPLYHLSRFMSSAAKARAELTERGMEMLCERRDEVLACILAAGDLETGCADIDLIKGLCDLRRKQVRPRKMMDIMTVLRQRQRVQGCDKSAALSGQLCAGSDEAS